MGVRVNMTLDELERGVDILVGIAQTEQFGDKEFRSEVLNYARKVVAAAKADELPIDTASEYASLALSSLIPASAIQRLSSAAV